MDAMTCADRETRSARAERVILSDEFDPDELLALAGEGQEYLFKDPYQYWRINSTAAIFSPAPQPGVWHVQLYFSGELSGEDVPDVKALVGGFWDAERPDYITSAINTNWAEIWITREAGFQQIGVLPTAGGTLITLGWRKCH